MQLAQIPADGNKYPVQATISNLVDLGKPVGQKGYMLQKFDIADQSKAIKGAAFFYAGNQPDMAFPLAWNGQTMQMEVAAKQNGQYINYSVSIPKGSSAQFSGGNPAHAAPINQAMAANNVQYQQPPQQAPQQSPAQQPYNPPAQVPAQPQEDPKARGMVRHGVICAILGNSAIDSSNPATVKAMAAEYIDYIMTGTQAGEPDQIAF